MKLILASPRGFCAGVERAINIVETALKKYGAPVYVRHEIVHNKHVVEDLRKKGTIFVKEVDEIPEGAVAIFSAHGVAEIVNKNAAKRNLDILDATCPLVTKVHIEAKRHEAEGCEIILIGHANHPEVIGTSGQVKQDVILVQSVSDVKNIIVNNPDNLAYVTQTTLSVDDTKNIINALKEKFPNIIGPDTKDICYATQNRQNAVKELAKQCDAILVIGAKNSSNSNRLRDLGTEMNIPSYLIDNADNIDFSWFTKNSIIGLTAGASAPEILVDQVIAKIKEYFPNIAISQIDGIVEKVKFKLPKKLMEQ
jgi:4-hydroxy-3-methylbut-2-en-1-yl diphosphate reductase